MDTISIEELLEMVPRNSLYLPQEDVSRPFFIFGDIRKVSDGWIAFIPDESSRSEFEKMLVRFVDDFYEGDKWKRILRM